MAISKPRSFVTYPNLELKNLVKGETDNPSKRLDGLYFDVNNTDANNALAVRQVFGADLADNGSIVGECRVTTPEGLFDAEHKVTIGDGTRLWKVQMTAADDLRFGNAHIVNGAAGPADYSAPAFIAALVIWSTGSDTVSVVVDKTEMVLTYDAPNALTGAEIARSSTNSQKVNTGLTNLETAFDVEHDLATGEHDAGFLEPGMVNQNTCLQAEAWQNIIRYGKFEFWPEGIDAPPEGWAAYGAPTAVERESGNVRVGTYSVKITTGGANRGIKYAIPNFRDYQEKVVTASCWVKEVVAGTVAITIDDGVGTTTGLAVVLNGNWQQAFCRHTLNNAASKLEVIIASVGGSPTFYLDETSAYEGTMLKAYSRSPEGAIAEHDVVPVNFLLNADFERWADVSGMADQWEDEGAPVSAPNADAHFGNQSLAIDDVAVIGCGFRQRIGDFSDILAHLQGKTVCFSVWVKEGTPGTSRKFALTIYDGISSNYISFDQDDYADWTRLWVVYTVDAAATQLTVSVTANQAAVVAGLLVDSACLNIGSRPMPWAGNMPSVWSPVRYGFFKSGTVADGTMLDEAWPVPERFYPMRLDAYWLTGPARVAPAGYTDLILYAGARGAAPATTGFYVRVDAETAPDADGVGASATQAPAAAESDVIDELKYLRIHTTNVGTSANPNTPSVLLTGYTLALP